MMRVSAIESTIKTYPNLNDLLTRSIYAVLVRISFSLSFDEDHTRMKEASINENTSRSVMILNIDTQANSFLITRKTSTYTIKKNLMNSTAYRPPYLEEENISNELTYRNDGLTSPVTENSMSISTAIHSSWDGL